MGWTAQDMQSRNTVGVTADQEKAFEQAKQEALPVVQKEADEGVRPFKPVDFQPVKSPGLYEAEFGVKGEDVIFHFWPWNYHLAEKQGQRPPNFPRSFETYLVQAMGDAFEVRRVEMHKDEDMGAYFVKAKGYASNQFNRELSIRACEKLHKLLGGE
jgi:hypothetical protein